MKKTTFCQIAVGSATCFGMCNNVIGMLQGRLTQKGAFVHKGRFAFAVRRW